MNENTYFIDVRDERELARLQVQDALFNEIIEMLPASFMPGPRARILDLACGPGGWPLQVSQVYPDVSVIGIDSSPQMIKYARAQAEARGVSTQFRIMNILKPWHFPDSYIDFVNARFITGLVPISSLDSLLEECWRVLCPGGTVRFTETVFLSSPLSPTSQKLAAISYQAMHRAGLCFSPYEMTTGTIIARMLRARGFERISFTPYVIDLSYGAPLHRPMLENLVQGEKLLESFIKQMQIASPEEIEALVQDFIRDWEDPNFCANYYVCSLSAVRPFEHE
ncbi:MAG TPA: class I SAM-dependent methyltransferase [Ktedonobacteraceae bacterium]|nr:class I SAM-dependent methyltransferase [Ktedonobacteraceae bacterium]